MAFYLSKSYDFEDSFLYVSIKYWTSNQLEPGGLGTYLSGTATSCGAAFSQPQGPGGAVLHWAPERQTNLVPAPRFLESKWKNETPVRPAGPFRTTKGSQRSMEVYAGGVREGLAGPLGPEWIWN